MSIKSNSLLTDYYENIEFNLPNASTSVPLSYITAANGYTVTGTPHNKYNAGSTTVACPRQPSRCVIRTNNTISISLTPAIQTGATGTAVNDSITIASTDSPFEIDGVTFGDILFTNNSSNTAAVKVFISDARY